MCMYLFAHTYKISQLLCCLYVLQDTYKYKHAGSLMLDNLPGPRQPGRRQHVVRAPHPTHHEPDPGARLAAHVHLHVPAQQLGDGHPLRESPKATARIP